MIQVSIMAFVTFLVLSSTSFWNLWVSLELFSFFLMPWLISGENKISKVHIFFYFLMQFLASIGFLVSSLTYINKLCSVVLFSSLLMKVSCFPFHSWFVNIIPHISWQKILMLVSMSKLIPLSALSLLMPPLGFIWTLILGLLVSLGGFQTTCLRSVLAYSSVAHSSWLVICTCLNKNILFLYIVCYFMLTLPLCLLLMKESLTSMKATLSSKKNQLSLIILILVLSGIPPFLGFIPKLLVVQMLTQSSALMEAGFLGVLSMLPLYFYFKTGILSLNMKFFLEFSFSSYSGLLAVLNICISLMALVFLVLSLSLYYKMLICQIKEMVP